MLGVLATKTINPLIFVTGEVHQRLWCTISDPRGILSIESDESTEASLSACS